MVDNKKTSYYERLLNLWTLKYGAEIANEKLIILKESYKHKDRSSCKTNEYKEKMSNKYTGNKNPMYGKSVYDIWISKYGREIADIKMSELKRKRSELQKGNKNNMYGKPSPNGSGNGWSGWYNGLFFKSLLELNCMILFNEQKIKFKSAENKKFKIKYTDWDGKEKNYYPDFFILKERKIIECKPKHLFTSANVLCKKKAALIFCEQNNYTYQLMDPGKIPNEKLIDMYNKGEIKFIDRYDLKFKEKYLN